MLLRLSSTQALARASFAGASVAVAFIGHALAHAHHDLPRVLVALLLLLGIVWGTNRRDLTFAGAIAAQFLVHGGIPTSPHMLVIHGAAVAAAYLVMRHSEGIWRALAHLVLGRLPRIAIAPRIARVPRILHGAAIPLIHRSLRSHAMRAPPALA